MQNTTRPLVLPGYTPQPPTGDRVGMGRGRSADPCSAVKEETSTIHANV